MYLLDTDTVSHLHMGHAPLLERLAALDDFDVGTTIITKAEILRGRIEYLLKAATGAEVRRAQEWWQQSELLLGGMTVVPFDAAAAMQLNRLQAVPGLKKIGRCDLLIASIALSQEATLVTRNLRHFQQVPGLRVVNWVG